MKMIWVLNLPSATAFSARGAVMSLNMSVLSTPAAKAEAAKAKTKVEARILTVLCWLLVLDYKVLLFV